MTTRENSKSDLVDIACEITAETEKAFKIDHGGEEECWVPKSQCEWDATVKTMTMPEWLALDKGIL